MSDSHMSEQRVGNEQPKCAHAACKCLAKPGEKFCSNYCAEIDELTEELQKRDVGRCNCGHAECM